MARRPRLGRVRLPAAGVGRGGTGPQRIAARHHRLRQDVRGLARDPGRTHAAPSAIAGGQRAAAHGVAHADARAGLRHHAGPGRAAGGSRAGVDHRAAYRRYARRGARAAGPALSDGAGDHARVAEPHAHARARARGTAGRGVRGGRRMARTARQQARGPGTARAGPPVALQSAAGRLGPERDAGQPGRRDGDPVPPGRGRRHADAAAGAGAHREEPRHRHADPHRSGQVFLGRAPGRADAAAGGGRDRPFRTDAGLHQRALSGGDLVPVAAGSQARLGRRDRAAPRLDRQGHPRLGGAGPEGRPAARRGRHLLAGPRGGLPAGGARAADRLAQGRRAHDAARRPQRARAGARQPAHAGADQHDGDHRSRRRARGDAGRAGGGAPVAGQTARRAGAAPGHGGAGRRLPGGRPVRRGAQCLGLPRAHARRVRLGGGVLRARRAQPHRLPRLPPHRAGRGRRVPGAGPAGRQAAPAGHRHHRQ